MKYFTFTCKVEVGSSNPPISIDIIPISLCKYDFHCAVFFSLICRLWITCTKVCTNEFSMCLVLAQSLLSRESNFYCISLSAWRHFADILSKNFAVLSPASIVIRDRRYNFIFPLLSRRKAAFHLRFFSLPLPLLDFLLSLLEIKSLLIQAVRIP